jgi:hypothetical protein
MNADYVGKLGHVISEQLELIECMLKRMSHCEFHTHEI